MNTLVSIIVTSYNHAEYLPQRMESLLAQTYNNYEIIVIDDCSTDGSLRVLSKYENRPGVRVVGLDKNGGYANACNLGVSLGSGDYIMFAECDDYNERDHVSVLLDRIQKNGNIGVAFCRSNVVDNNGRFLRDDFMYRADSFKVLCSQETVINKEKMQRFLLQSCVLPNMSAALIKKKYFQAAGGLSDLYSACADWDFWCRMSRLCDFYYVPRALNFFRTHETTVRSTFKMELQLCEMFALLFNASKKIELSLRERFEFRENVASVWAGYFSENPHAWIRSFFPVWRQSIKYDKLSLFFLACTVFKRLRQKLAARNNLRT